MIFSVILLLTNHETLYNLNIVLSFHPPFGPITALFYNYRSVTCYAASTSGDSPVRERKKSENQLEVCNFVVDCTFIFEYECQIVALKVRFDIENLIFGNVLKRDSEMSRTISTGYKCGFVPDCCCRNLRLLKHDHSLATFIILSYDVASGSEITPCNKINKPLVVYRFTGNIMTSKTTLRT